MSFHPLLINVKSEWKFKVLCFLCGCVDIEDDDGVAKGSNQLRTTNSFPYKNVSRPLKTIASTILKKRVEQWRLPFSAHFMNESSAAPSSRPVIRAQLPSLFLQKARPLFRCEWHRRYCAHSTFVT